MKAFLILEDGTVFEGTSIGSEREAISEIVFNTSMAGYMEALTDPSYAGQAVVMTYPLIGNYGICVEDMESDRTWANGFIVRELSRIPSNFRSGDTIQHFLTQHDIPGISGIDTRALTRILREKGTMNGMITTNEAFVKDDVIAALKAYKVSGKLAETSAKDVTVLPGEGCKVAVVNYGSKRSILRTLNAKGCELTVYPAIISAEEILKTNPDGILLTDGPGNPEEYTEQIAEVKKLFEAGIPMFAIGLGHQLLALAAGAKTYKLHYSHCGGNHPVKDLETGIVYITSQNNTYAVCADSLDANVAAPAYVNVNDKTNEGIKYAGKKIMSIQFNPDELLIPQNNGTLFDRFIAMMKEDK